MVKRDILKLFMKLFIKKKGINFHHNSWLIFNTSKLLFSFSTKLPFTAFSDAQLRDNSEKIMNN